MNIIDVGLWSTTMPVTSGSVSITSEAKTLFPWSKKTHIKYLDSTYVYTKIKYLYKDEFAMKMLLINYPVASV